MKSSRRDFLKRGTLVALAAGVPLGVAEAVAGKSPATSPASGLTLDAFKSQKGTTFLINEEALKVKVTLIDVTNLASRKQTAAGKEGFSLLFRGSNETTLKQNTYVIEHHQLGMFSFLLVPVRTKDTHAPYYQAVINRLHP
jgi:hypothetical protein